MTLIKRDFPDIIYEESEFICSIRVIRVLKN